ncbi:MAG: type III-B CRISPR module RAMP protein Cmr1 [Rhodothermales bacterium]
MDPIYCKVVTPMFLAGTDKQTLEFRAPSIRGALRWWFRAVAGGYTSLTELKRMESRLFGDSGNTGASSLIVRVWADAFDKTQKAPMLPHKTGNQQALTECVPTGTLFGVSLNHSPYCSNPLAVETATALFYLLAAHGGLGRRSRRGFGAFQPVDWKPEDEKAVKRLIKEKVQNARQAVKAFIDAHPPSTPPTFGANAVSDFPVLHPDVATIRIGEAREWDPFIKALMSKCSNIKGFSRRVLGSGSPRQASTLVVSVIKTKDGSLVPIYSQFYSNTVVRVVNKRPSLTPTVQRSAANNEFAQIEALPAKVSSSLDSVTIV